MRDEVWVIGILLFWIAVIAVIIPFINEKVRGEQEVEKEYWKQFNERMRFFDAMFSKEAGYSAGLISKEAGFGEERNGNGKRLGSARTLY